ncbi:MAG: hypothetical protein GF317_01190 [Candidatus Lokiarchaeota archaeon]|nr:hypothetical protein [Candidatus Lokiarchaeota archaeon]MBD3198572.1 hypothetical protein [Candidatus Lokiarchaeota archaeon]
MIIEKTIDLIHQIYRNYKISKPTISKVVLGLGYSCVELLPYGYEPILGVAYTLPSLITSQTCSKIDFAGNLTDRKAIELLEWAKETPSIKKVIGIAVMNALSQHILKIKNPYVKINENLIDYLKLDEKKKVLFIGSILPLIKSVLEFTKNIIVVEKSHAKPNKSKNVDFKSDLAQLNEVDYNCDVLICTGTTLINDTIFSILDKFRKKSRFIALIGPTASMIPDILFDYGVDLVGGMTFQDTKSAIKVIQEGGGTRLFKKYGKKFNFINNN